MSSLWKAAEVYLRLRSRGCAGAAWPAVVICVAAAWGPAPAAAQPNPGGAAARKAAKPAGDEVPPPEDVSLTTGDGLGLAMTYFPGTKGKDSIPVILLHAMKGSRQDFIKDGGLAPYLQEKLGCAVLAPDLRGHGESTTITLDKKTKTLSAAKLQPSQFALMITQDLQAVKDFLWKKNNARDLNIDKLCVVGFEMGASVALDFALYDAMGYDQGTPVYGPLKLGRFVKSLVLVSPEWSFPGLKTADAVKSADVQRNISVMVLVGKDNPKFMADAKRFNDMFARYHSGEEDKPMELKTLWFGRLETSLEGAKLLDTKATGPGIDTPKLVGKFLYYRMVKNPEASKIAWKERKRPHE
ncbi:MAG: alpha/beta fold hydrolase [Thermoguttaceae bacterium]